MMLSVALVQEFIISFIALASFLPNAYVLADQRFIEFPTESNENILVDLKAKPKIDILKSFTKVVDTNRYLLYTRENRESAQVLELEEGPSVEESYFDPNVPTAIIIHGWHSQPTLGLGPVVRDALLDSSNVNVIVVDWRRLSCLDYVTAVAGVPLIGRNIGQFIAYLNSVTGAPLSSMHLIGHSLGAHVAGNAGRVFDGQVARVTGLDPAGPTWYLNPTRLKPSDAVYVEAIHTNAAALGIKSNVADVDIYVNGGSLQPGCSTPTCHHGRSYELFAASLTNPDHLIGRKCQSLVQMHRNLCKGDRLPLGNNDLKKTGSGIYLVNTSSKYPF